MFKNLSIYIVFILLVYSCDPGGSLLVQNGDKSKLIEYDGISLTFSLRTIANTNFSLEVDIYTEKDISLFTDSLKIFFKDKIVNYEIRYKEEIYHSKIINLKEGSSIFFYGFDLDKGVVKKDDEINIYAKNYIKRGNIFFNLDTLKFIVLKEY